MKITKETIIAEIIERLEEYKGQEVRMEEIGYLLTESEAGSGSWYCSEYKAKQEIAENIDLFADFSGYFQDIFGETPNLIESEKWHCAMMIAIIEIFFTSAISLSSLSDAEKVLIDDNFIDYISEILNKQNIDNIFS